MAADNVFDAFADLCKALIKDMRRGKVDLFHRIDDAQCILRQKGGVFKQAELYRRKDRIYVKHGSGFLRLLAPWDNVWGTTAPSISVIDMPDDVGIVYQAGQEPRWGERQ